MKKQKVYLVLASLLAILSIFAIVYQRGGFSKSRNSKNLSTIFAIKDTVSVTKIFMADLFGDQVLLSKTDKGWMVDNYKPADIDKIKDLLITMVAIRVAQPIAKNAQSSIIQMLAVSSTKVEIYETKPLFKIFGKPFFTKERLSKTYFLGDATQNSLGSFASIEGRSEPYIIYKPGFRGYVRPQFSPKALDWYSQLLFSTRLTQIQSASFIDYDHPENSFYVNKSGPRSFALLDANKNEVARYDTALLINMLSEFRERYYEMFLPNIPKSLKDSVLQFNHFKTISVTDINNQTTTLNLYFMIDEGELYENDELIDPDYTEVNQNRCYATINDNTDEIYTIQFMQFARQTQPFFYFLKRDDY